MKCFVIRGRVLVYTFFAILALCVGVGGLNLKPVFKVGGREVPIYCVDRHDNKVALTFNCAWGDEDIDNILKTLEANDVKCTFFIVGEWAEKYPESVKKIYEKGHEIANHSYAHDHYSSWSKEQILADINKCDNLLGEITGERPTLFRAAFGEYNDDVVSACEANGRYYIQWSVDSLDYKAQTPDDIYNRVLPIIKSGDIVLMHTGTENTAKILPKLISEISKEYSLCKVSDIIYKDDYTIDATGKQKTNGLK